MGAVIPLENYARRNERWILTAYREASDDGKKALVRLMKRLVANEDVREVATDYLVARGLNAVEAAVLADRILARHPGVGRHA